MLIPFKNGSKIKVWPLKSSLRIYYWFVALSSFFPALIRAHRPAGWVAEARRCHPWVDTGSDPVFNGRQMKFMEREELDITAHLARLELSDEETKRFEQAVVQMLEYFSKMREFDVEGLPPTAQMTQTNRTRKDAAIVNEDTEAILGNAPELEDRFIVIPNVL